MREQAEEKVTGNRREEKQKARTMMASGKGISFSLLGRGVGHQ